MSYTMLATAAVYIFVTDVEENYGGNVGGQSIFFVVLFYPPPLEVLIPLKLLSP